MTIVTALLTLAAAPAVSPERPGVARPTSPAGRIRPAALGATMASTPPSTVPSAVTARPPILVDRAADGLFYVEAAVNGKTIRFVVDSGASVVVLSAVDARRAAVGGDEGIDVDTAGGKSPMRRAQIKQVALAGRRLTDVDAAIVDRNLPVSLLGQSALSQLDSVSFRGSRLELR